MTYNTDHDGNNRWYKYGKLHREDGPAAEYITGDKAWFLDGKLHREDGPAVEYADGRITWWIDNTKLTPANFAAKMLDKETALLWKMGSHCWPFDFGLNK
jgi:hypothetical protein